jgi:hypothetical protein
LVLALELGGGAADVDADGYEILRLEEEKRELKIN